MLLFNLQTEPCNNNDDDDDDDDQTDWKTQAHTILTGRNGSQKKRNVNGVGNGKGRSVCMLCVLWGVLCVLGCGDASGYNAPQPLIFELASKRGSTLPTQHPSPPHKSPPHKSPPLHRKRLQMLAVEISGMLLVNPKSTSLLVLMMMMMMVLRRMGIRKVTCCHISEVGGAHAQQGDGTVMMSTSTHAHHLNHHLNRHSTSSTGDGHRALCTST